MSTSAIALKEIAEPHRRRPVDLGMLAGIALAIAAVVAGIAVTGIHLSYFVQPSGILIVFGGTLGVTFVTTPRQAFTNALRTVAELIWEQPTDRESLIQEILSYLRNARAHGLLSIESLIENASHPLLRQALRLALDVPRHELKSAVETKLRMNERRGDSDAKTFEVAGGFAPTIGVIGTVVGLVDVLRRFFDAPSVAIGVGTAFASTLYGLALANLLLLPVAHRIRATVAERFETEELILEGVLCIIDGVHPSLLPDRLNAFLREKKDR